MTCKIDADLNKISDLQFHTQENTNSRSEYFSANNTASTITSLDFSTLDEYFLKENYNEVRYQISTFCKFVVVIASVSGIEESRFSSTTHD